MIFCTTESDSPGASFINDQYNEVNIKQYLIIGCSKKKTPQTEISLPTMTASGFRVMDTNPRHEMN